MIKHKYTLILLFFILFSFQYAEGQNETEVAEKTIYRFEFMGSVASGEQTPFWMVSNRYGIVPLESGNGFTRAGVFHNQTFGSDFRWTAGVDLVGAFPRKKNVYLHQLYAEIGYKAFLLSVGSKERYHSIVNRRLSSGDMVLSPNARPIPEINFSIPEYTKVPFTRGWLQIRGDFALGRSFDKDYLKDYTLVSKKPVVYVDNILWHHKSFFVRIEDTKNKQPLFATLGFEHWAQWGGTSTNPQMGKQPQTIKDFMRIVFGREGGEGSTISDMLNVLGNHYGSYYLGLGYKLHDASMLQAYYQHYFEDKSGTVFANGFDGLWGVEFNTKQIPWLSKIVVEFLTTKNQSGPMHFIHFDRDKYSGRGGGSDNYYNNVEYATGVSYFNRAIGSPLLISPEYNGDGKIGFYNNRVQSWHLGAEGTISSQVSYRLLLTTMKGWGLPFKPFIATKSSVATLVEVAYSHPRLVGWKFFGSVSVDTGDMIEKNTGFSLSIRKQGILKNW